MLIDKPLRNAIIEKIPINEIKVQPNGCHWLIPNRSSYEMPIKRINISSLDIL